MIIRIVRMTFEPAQVESFQELFNATKHLIRHFDGCERLELLRDVKETNVFFTYSWWQSEEHLNKYRFSPLFKEV
ncbi:MAG TPA: antibiotic biosynthesis monooxygenase family protein, partial [Bacteroidia bacterium]|nr:antibiotic biosynthesis monooxygenase family protein [Bacteroidia bacterium]